MSCCKECRHYKVNEHGAWWGLCLAHRERPDVCEEMICRKFEAAVSERLMAEADAAPVQAAHQST